METKTQQAERTGGQWFGLGLRNGIPICLGYFAVSFALGISARNAGLHAFQAFLMSLLMVASAGEFAALTLITAGAGGNLIDCVFLVYMRDFMYFVLIDFQIFNVADIYVKLSAALFM